MSADAGALLAGVRREAGLTQAELARRAKTSQAMVARYETGTASPTVRTLARLLRAAGHELELSGPATSPQVPSNALAAALLRAPGGDQDSGCSRRRRECPSLRVGGARGGDAGVGSRSVGGLPAGGRGLFPLLQLAAEIERLVGRPVDVAAVEVMAEPVRERALAEAIPL